MEHDSRWPHTDKRLWSIADVQLADWPYGTDAAHLFLHDGGNVGFIIPTAKGRYRAVANTTKPSPAFPAAIG
jgi:hypothetical protein